MPLKELNNIQKQLDKERKKEIPYEMLEYANCSELINSIIEYWYEDFEYLIKEENGDLNFNKSLIANCMISYRKFIHNKLDL